MKNLVLGALLATVVSSAACTADTSAVITAHWSFNTFANKAGPATDPCPVVGSINYDTATVYVRPWDPFVGDFTGPAVASDLFSCSDKLGTTAPLDGIFQVWVQIEDHNGANVYARSEALVIDTADGDASITLPTLFKDAGYFDMSWDLVHANAPTTRLRCSEVGLTSDSRISTTAVANSNNAMFVDKFPCDDGYGVTSELPVGLYLVTVSVSASAGNDIGASGPIPDKEIKAPNGLTSLGHVKITFQ
jgi:hypothetical protein